MQLFSKFSNHTLCDAVIKPLPFIKTKIIAILPIIITTIIEILLHILIIEQIEHNIEHSGPR